MRDSHSSCKTHYAKVLCSDVWKMKLVCMSFFLISQESKFDVALIALSIPNSQKIIRTGKHDLKLIS
jgi:hypothetical protein